MSTVWVLCTQSLPAREGDEKSGHHSWALPSGLTTASQDVPSLYTQGREGSTNQGPGQWVPYPGSHSYSALGTCCKPPHSLTSTPPPHTVNRNCIPHIPTPTHSNPSWCPETGSQWQIPFPTLQAWSNSRAHGLLFASMAEKFSYHDCLTLAVGSTCLKALAFSASSWQNLFSFILK